MTVNLIKANGRLRKVEVENAQMIWTNFSGREGRYNPAGRRNFNIVLNAEDAEKLKQAGFNVKYHEPREEGVDPIYTLKINVNFGSYNPPEVYMKNSHGNVLLDENGVSILDGADILETWLCFNPHVYEDSVTAYLNKLLVTVRESDYESKFFDTPDSAMNTTTFNVVPSLDD